MRRIIWNLDVNLVLVGLMIITLELSFGGPKLVQGLGVNWGTYASHRLPPEKVVQLLKDNGFTKVKLFDADESILTALAGSGIEVMVGAFNNELKDMTRPEYATQWVNHNVLRHLPKNINITLVGIGNEPYLKDYKDKFVNVTFPALRNIQRALNDAGVGKKVKATVPFNGDVYLSPNYNPVPSGGIFRPDIADSVLEIVEYLDKNDAPFMINIYPFLSLYMSKGAFPFDYAFFDGGHTITDGQIEYDNVLDANYDTCISALKKVGYGNTTVMVGEIGWPTDGNAFANISLASRFYNGMMKKLAAGKGTPLRPGYMEVYVFSLLDEDAKSILPGDFERHWGIFRYDGQPKFPLDLSGSTKPNENRNSTLVGKNGTSTLVGAKDVEYQPTKWCILKPDAENTTKIDANTDYACNFTDCTALADGASCSGLDDHDKASYVFNAYFQWANQSSGSCGFEGLATLSSKDPSTDRCNFTIQIAVETPAPAPAPFGSSADEMGPMPQGRRAGGHSAAAQLQVVQSPVTSLMLSVIVPLLLLLV